MKWIYLLIISTLISCGSIKPDAPLLEANKSNTEPQTGTIRVPVEFNLTQIFKEVDNSLDYQFKGEKEQCEDVSFSYVFKRNELGFTGQKGSIFTNVDGAYSIKANYCAKCSDVFGSDPFCLTPRLFVSCGVGESMRKIKIEFETKLQLSSDYRLEGKSKLKGLESIDPCKFTFLKYDASALIEKEISKALKEVETKMDEEIRKVDLRPMVEKAWNELSKPIFIDNFGYLHLQPQSLGLDDFQFDKNKVRSTIELGVKPTVLSEPSQSKIALPPLKNNKYPEGLKIPLLISLNYDSLNAIIDSNFQPIELDAGKKKKIIIRNIDLVGPKLGKTVIKVNFEGSKKGVLYLIGNPTFQKNGTEVAMKDVEFDVETKDLILKLAKWLFQDKITQKLEEKLIFDISMQIADAKKEIDKQLNQSSKLSNGQKIQMKGKLTELLPKSINPSLTNLDVMIYLGGELKINFE